MRYFAFLLLSLIITNVQARDWARLPIPDAYCGDGLQYSVFVDIRDQNKWAFELMGGGACWSTTTCWGPNFRTWIHPVPEIDNYSVLTADESPLSSHSMVYFPYCTGDVYAGTHTAEYGLGVKIKHHGALNIQKTLNHLRTLGLLTPEKIDELVVYGSSAGAIGSLFHSKTFDDLLGERAHKINKKIIADSPGLHFGENFWLKFTDAHMKDFKDIFAGIDLYPSFDTGMLAPIIRDFCDARSDWKVAFLQSTRDPIMSIVFGNISPNNHRDLILGKEGLPNSLRGSENCKTWVVDKVAHTFLLFGLTSRMGDETSLNQDAYKFVSNFLEL